MGKKIALAAGNLLCVLAILVSALVGWTVITTPAGQAPSLFGHYFMTVLTGSMEPAIPRGSMLVVKQVEPATIQPGDVITFYTTIGTVDGMINTHRVEEVLLENGNYSFRTRGDANPIADPVPVPADQILGRVSLVSHFVGTVIGVLRQKLVFFVAVLIPLLLILVTYILRLVRMAKEEIASAEKELRSEYEASSAHPTTPGDSPNTDQNQTPPHGS
ncbi:MAG: signal peptidase I [Oscillospiraceae bacterium]